MALWEIKLNLEARVESDTRTKKTAQEETERVFFGPAKGGQRGAGAFTLAHQTGSALPL